MVWWLPSWVPFRVERQYRCGVCDHESGTAKHYVAKRTFQDMEVTLYFEYTCYGDETRTELLAQAYRALSVVGRASGYPPQVGDIIRTKYTDGFIVARRDFGIDQPHFILLALGK